MDFALTPEQEMVVSTVRSFVEHELYPLEAEVERTGEVPAEIGREITRKVQELGFYAPNIPEEFGGGGLDHLTFTLLERELGRASYALSVFWGRPSNILCGCNAEQRERYLLPAARGERVDCLAMTEPEAGSDVRSMKTTARRVGGDWVIDGTKHFISHADLADFAIVFVATGSEETKAGPKQRITCFLVDRGTPGFEIRPGYRSVSHRGYHNCILNFDGCRVPDAQILGEEGGGFELMNTWLYATRLTVAATSVGRARRAFDLAAEWAASRKQFGQPIGKFQGTSFKLADMATEIDAADLLTLNGAWMLDQRPRRQPHDRPGQALRHRDAGAGDRQRDPDLRRHGADGGDRHRALLARRPGRADLGRHQRDPAPHHQPRHPPEARGVTRGSAPTPTLPRCAGEGADGRLRISPPLLAVGGGGSGWGLSFLA